MLNSNEKYNLQTKNVPRNNKTNYWTWNTDRTGKNETNTVGENPGRIVASNLGQTEPELKN